MIERYGLEFDDSWTETMIELACFVHDVELGGGRHGHLRNAMMLLWPHIYAGEQEHGVPKWRDEIELMTWAWCKYRITAVLGHASAAKTHTFGHMVAAAYAADSLNTIVTLTSTHLPGLRRRLWADVCSAIRTSTMADQFQIRNHDLVIRPEGSSEEKYVINGIATDKTQAAVEKIQGNHSRLHQYVVIDEAQGTSGAVFDAAANLMTDRDFRMGMLANPTKKISEFGSWCEPADGWSRLDPDLDLWWETKRGGVCIRLDGLKSPNLRLGRTIFPFLIREDYVETIKASYGEGSARWWIYVRGWFPPDGLMGHVFPSNLLTRADSAIVYQLPPRKIAALDPAFEGGDQCQLVFGEYGSANGSPFAMNVTEVVPVKVAVSENSLPLDYLIAFEVMRICKSRGVLPEDFIADSTAAGRGVCAILQREWSPNIEKCYFGGKPTERLLKVGDDRPSSALFDRFVTELWFAGRAWMEEGLIGNLGPFKVLREQLASRQYETINEQKDAVETKRDMKDRLGFSPDEGDCFNMLVELLRRKGGTAGSTSKFVAGTRDERLLERARRYAASVDPSKEFSYPAS